MSKFIEKMRDIWEKHHTVRYIEGGCSTCYWDEQILTDENFNELIYEMDAWIKETYGKGTEK